MTTAIRAEEKAKGAHERLDRMNGSIDRLKEEVGRSKLELSAEIAVARQEAKDQTNAILLRLSHDDGVDSGTSNTKTSMLDSRWRVITLAVTLMTGGFGVALFTYITRRHG